MNTEITAVTEATTLPQELLSQVTQGVTATKNTCRVKNEQVTGQIIKISTWPVYETAQTHRQLRTRRTVCAGVASVTAVPPVLKSFPRPLKPR